MVQYCDLGRDALGAVFMTTQRLPCTPSATNAAAPSNGAITLPLHFESPCRAELSEDDYWNAVERLERLTPDEITGRHRDPHITGAIRPDYSAPETGDYLVWLDSLVQRGFLPRGPFRQLSR